ncbi:speckle-type POZ protein-like B [Trichonephila inaurata madagascariensis]|uniref:Speckle-type POZ protein-like B n=1 Tax=Trichonephila inaurata madagascariensis TaxID=2747483 RepID=A0A8X6XMM3_9ARAC|nr:speckle-type POZ protein-like B [Trichonephila inaurata madagascariensis]
MDCEVLSENKCFTFTWIIENFSYSWQNIGEYISSPTFIVDQMQKTKWRLDLYPKGDEEETKGFISFYLSRVEDCQGPEGLDIHFDLSFLANDDSVLVTTDTVKEWFSKGMYWYADKFVKCDEVLKIRRKDYLPGNVLTARCRMWNIIQEDTEYGHCFARTRIGVQRKLLVWNIEQFSSFQGSLFEICSTSAGVSMMTCKFFPSSGHNSKTFIFEVGAHDEMLKTVNVRLYLVDCSRNRTECLNEEFIFTETIRSALFTLNLSEEELMKNKNRYFPNDILQLYCEWDIINGIVLQEIEKTIYGSLLSIQDWNLTSDGFKSKFRLDSKHVLKENLESLYKENVLCDTKLKTKTGSFPAHKSILSARSPVFQKMFTNDMREKNSECVDMEDLDDDTVQRLLLYIYTATLPDLLWDSACNLYAAADKYEILSLKCECSSFLKDNLSQDNCCDLFILADTHQDEDLNAKNRCNCQTLRSRDISRRNGCL